MQVSVQNTVVEPIRLVVAEAMERMLRAGESFTALDVSNQLKQHGFAVRHGEVAPVVRDLYAHGALSAFDYDRELIEVNTEGGAKMAEAFLYLPQNALPSDYGRRVQDALPPVPADLARDLASYVPSSYPAVLLQTASNSRRRNGSGGTRGKIRRDGALPIAKRWVREAGWQVGDELWLRALPNANGETELCLTVTPVSDEERDVSWRVRVWGSERVRIARTKLQSGTAFGNDVTCVAIRCENGCLHIGHSHNAVGNAG